MTAKTTLNKSKIAEIVEWLKRMHCFHPGKYYAAAAALSAGVALVAGVLVAIPFMV